MKPSYFVILSLLFCAGTSYPDRDLEKDISSVSKYSDSYWEHVASLELTAKGAEEPLLKKYLDSGTEYQRLAAAYIISKSAPSNESINTLVRLCASKDAFISSGSAGALVKIFENSRTIGQETINNAIERLNKLASPKTNQRARVNIIACLYKFNPTISLKKSLEKIFDEASSKVVKDEAAIALAELGWPSADVKRHLLVLAQEPGRTGLIAQTFTDLLRLKDNIAKPQFTFEYKYDFSRLQNALSILEHYYFDPTKVDVNKMIDHALRAICSTLDPYTVYMDEKDVERLQKEELEGKYGGIGARVSMKKDRHGTRWLSIEEPIIGGPCFRSGIRSGDKIIEIEGTSTANKELRDLVSLLKGKPGTAVKVKVFSLRWDKPREMQLTREEITMSLIHYKMLPGNIGYIKLVAFSKDAGDLVKKAVNNLKAAKGFILDVRGNGGGYLNAAVDVADVFLEGGKLVTEKKSMNKNIPDKETIYTQKPKVTDLPLVVLIDNGSASASEIIAGALKDHQRSVLIGEKTFGKGSVQQLIPLSKGSKAVVKVTVAKWFLPSGRSVNDNGIEPDKIVEFPEPDLWKLREFDRFSTLDDFQKYLSANFQQNKARFAELAECDYGKTDKYPAFDELYSALDTKASKEEVREYLRYLVRNKVQEDTKEKLFYDYQEDVQLQAAIRELAKQCNIDISNIREYSSFAVVTASKDTHY